MNQEINFSVCLFDHHNNPYPIAGYGGVERFNQLLFNKLGFLGIKVTLICVDTSTIEPSFPNQSIIKLSHRGLKRIRFGKTPVSKYTNAEIFHSHTSSERHSNFNFKKFYGKWVATCHGDLERAGAPFLCFVSRQQMERHFELDLLDEAMIKKTFITHGCVESTHLKYDETGIRNKIVWFARICKAKGINRLIEISKRINEPILVAGTIDEKEVFDELIKRGNIDYYGPINTEEDKGIFFAKAKLALHTSEFFDPFPLSIIEAQQCGVPVATWANGSVLESNFDTSNVFQNIEEIVDYINEKRFMKFNNKEIENWAKNKFSGDSLVNDYLGVYQFANNFPKDEYKNPIHSGVFGNIIKKSLHLVKTIDN
ncbi:glycosyltransferase [Parasediminibacterium sp. JCM 36343]|uniref:glycosyltransferase n=1 Tax=Parasediminibacterium sp. JCM 36343 TaxID=3374279 RepID=UPI00397DD203